MAPDETTPNPPPEGPQPPPAAASPGHAAEEAALSEAAGELDAVQAALDRLDSGTFESCDVCGAPIGRERLQQDPLLTRCPEHSTAP